jgi:pimeloyl-ACP methyl ester carboxylesterase
MSAKAAVTVLRPPDPSPRTLTQRRCGQGPPLVLLHGLGLSWRSWRPVLGLLAEQHDVVVPDLPASGPRAARRRSPSDPRRPRRRRRSRARPARARRPCDRRQLPGRMDRARARAPRRARCVVAIAPSGLESPPERAFVIAMNEAMRLRARVRSSAGAPDLASRGDAGDDVLRPASRPWKVEPEEGAEEMRDFGRSPASRRRSGGRSGPACRPA